MPAKSSWPDFGALKERLSLSETGGLSLNGQEMILLPRHFFRYILRDVRAEAGPEIFDRIFKKTGHDGALTFCRRFREFHGCAPQEAAAGYFHEMSLRGWGRFSIVRLEPEKGSGELLLEGSAIGAEENLPAGHVIWEGALVGVLRFLRECAHQELPKGVETKCESGRACRITAMVT